MMTSIVKYLKVVGGFALVLSLINCTPEQSTRKRSFVDNKVKQDFDDEVVIKNAEAEKLEQLMRSAEQVVLKESSVGAGQADVNLLRQKVIISLKDVVLNMDNIFNNEVRYARTSSGRFIMPRLVSLLNEAVLLVNKTNPEMLPTELLSQYKKIIIWDCDSNNQGSCEGVKFFRESDSVNMGQIVKLIYANETLESEKRRIVSLGFEMKNRRLDSALRFILLERLANSLDSVDSEKIDVRKLAPDAELFANILNLNSKSLGKDDGVSALLESLNPWLLSRNVDNAKNPAMTGIVKLAAKNLLYKEDGSLSSKMKNEVIPSLLYAIGNDYEQGPAFLKDNINGKWAKPYLKYLKEKESGEQPQGLSDLQQKVFPKIEASLGVDLYGPESKGILNTFLKDLTFEDEELDEYFYLANQAFYGHFNLDDASAFWDSTDKNVSRIMTELEKLVKTQIVNNIVLTNNRMNNFYGRNENSKLIELLRESDKEASKIRKAWTKTIVRTKAVKSFITRVVNPNTLDAEGKKQYERISSTVDALAKNIKFLVTYPNMFPLMHVMAKLEMSDTIRTWFGTFTVDSVTVIANFFAGFFQPLFNFGNDGVKLDATEIIYTYYYALTSQIFEIYATNPLFSAGLESPEDIHKDFFEVVVKKLILSDEKTLEAEKASLFQDIETYKNNAKALKRICAEEERLQEVESKELSQWKETLKDQYDWYEMMRVRKVMRPRQEMKNQISFTDLGYILYDAVNPRAEKMGSYIKKIYGDIPKRVFRNMRVDFPQKEVLAGTLLDVYKDTRGDDQTEIDKIFNEQFQEYYRLKAEYIKLYTGAESDVRGCDWLLLKRARDIRHMLIFREVEYLGNLFDEIWTVLSPLSAEERQALTATSPAAKELEKIRQKFAAYSQNDQYPAGLETTFPDEYQIRFGYNKITANQVTSYKMDTAARIYGYLHEMFPGQYEITMPADFKTMDIYRETSPDIIYYDWSLNNQTDAREAFISSGIKALANQMSWAESSVSLDDQMDKTDVLVELFKQGSLTKNPEINCNNYDLDAEVRKENCYKVEVSELLDQYEKSIDFLNIDDRDFEILKMLGKETKYSISIYEEFIKKKDEHRLYSYYDLAFKRIFTDTGVKATEETWFGKTLINYVNSVHKINSSTFIFPTPGYISDAFVERYQSWLKEYYHTNFIFLEAIKSRIVSSKPFQLRYRIDRVSTVGSGSNEWSQNKNVSLEPLVSDLIYGKFEGLSQQLNNDTSRFFSKSIWEEKKHIVNLVSPEETKIETNKDEAP